MCGAVDVVNTSYPFTVCYVTLPVGKYRITATRRNRAIQLVIDYYLHFDVAVIRQIDPDRYHVVASLGSATAHL